ncbi:MAG: amino acid ABC transporter ATP-binding protein [Selenomonadaceae bacterium]|nr:amino acid ABC transporter ATP-binding protein [Selenomonadaceae bacterium]MBQ6131814.1 amino acid ABC transporter ATP-binding protein [Selenomonadaceae bacterium]MBQ7493778.1 amino acid ABC transporter ATP-binding protein [Selenomonadaceae bacterium]
MIEVRGLKKSFDELEVLRGIDLTVESGERLAIIGGSGCGKSVFLRCLELLETPNAGQIFIDGEELTAPNVNIDLIRRKMGMVWQKFNLFTHMNVIENLTVAPIKLLGMTAEAAREKAMRLLAQVGLTTKADAYPEFLSGGQQQRIAICRSLMMNPKVILFDEPTSALDPTMVGEVLAVIRMLAKQDLTMIIVTHEMNFAREVATKILFFADGEIYEQGTPAEIFDAPKRPKTVAFIHKQKYFSYEIFERAFDLMKLQGGIQTFAEKYGLSFRRTNRIQLCCEELIYEMLTHACDGDDVKISLDVTYAEVGDSVEIKFSCAGKSHNPLGEDLDKFDEENLGATILRGLAKNFSHEFVDGVNKIEFSLS